MESHQYITYRRAECAVFLKTTERFGGLSNMAGGYPLSLNGIRILTWGSTTQAVTSRKVTDESKCKHISSFLTKKTQRGLFGHTYLSHQRICKY